MCNYSLNKYLLHCNYSRGGRNVLLIPYLFCEPKRVFEKEKYVTFSTKQFDTILLEAVVERSFFCLFCTKCRCMVLDSFSYWYWPAALMAINPLPKQKRSCKIRYPLCRQGGSCLVLFFSLSLSLSSSSVFPFLPPTVCSDFIKSEGNRTGSHCWGSTPIRAPIIIPNQSHFSI